MGTKLTEKEIRRKCYRVWDMGKLDPQYHQMLLELKELETNFENVLRQLSMEQQDIINDFVYHCEGMSWRMLEFACSCMVFTDEKA